MAIPLTMVLTIQLTKPTKMATAIRVAMIAKRLPNYRESSSGGAVGSGTGGISGIGSIRLTAMLKNPVTNAAKRNGIKKSTNLAE